MSHIPQIHRAFESPKLGGWRVCYRVIFWIVSIAIFISLAWCGWHLRATVWDWSRPIRAHGDINNGFSKGLGVYETAKREAASDVNYRYNGWQKALIRIGALSPANAATPPAEVSWSQFFNGYLQTYDLAAASAKQEGGTERYALDYTPLRLLVMSAWVKQVKTSYPDARRWREEYTPFMLNVNSGFEIAGALLIGLLVWDTLRRWRKRKVFVHEIAEDNAKLIRSSDHAILAGALAAMIFWLNPSNLLDAHAWPQWDLWLVPFYLLAMWLAVREHFFWAGVAIAVGAMFKGQILLAAPIFVLWPLFQFRLGRALLVIVGLVCGLLLCASAWLVPTREAWIWMACVAPMAAIFATCSRAPQLTWSWWLAAVIASGLIVWPWLNEDFVLQIFLPLTFAAIICVLPSLLPRRAGFGVFTVLLCAAMVVSSHRFGGSWNWFVIGFLWPTQQYHTLTMGYTCNLAWLLQDLHYSIDTVWYSITVLNFNFDLTTRHTLGAMYALTLCLCGWGAAMHAKRHDPRLLISLAAPWILAFALLSQMHERYLVWGAAILGVGCAVSAGMTLLQLIVIATSSAMILNDMIYSNGGETFAPLRKFFVENRQGMSWMLLLTAMIYLYVAIAPQRRVE